MLKRHDFFLIRLYFSLWFLTTKILISLIFYFYLFFIIKFGFASYQFFLSSQSFILENKPRFSLLIFFLLHHHRPIEIYKRHKLTLCVHFHLHCSRSFILFFFHKLNIFYDRNNNQNLLYLPLRAFFSLKFVLLF